MRLFIKVSRTVSERMYRHEARGEASATSEEAVLTKQARNDEVEKRQRFKRY